MIIKSKSFTQCSKTNQSKIRIIYQVNPLLIITYPFHQILYQTHKKKQKKPSNKHKQILLYMEQYNQMILQIPFLQLQMKMKMLMTHLMMLVLVLSRDQVLKAHVKMMKMIKILATMKMIVMIISYNQEYSQNQKSY